MLRGSPQPVGEIASRLGYSSTAAFSTAFRRMAGVSPMAYRQASGRRDRGN
jgi:AraC-like DNA-binding protein